MSIVFTYILTFCHIKTYSKFICSPTCPFFTYRLEQLSVTHSLFHLWSLSQYETTVCKRLNFQYRPSLVSQFLLTRSSKSQLTWAGSSTMTTWNPGLDTRSILHTFRVSVTTKELKMMYLVDVIIQGWAATSLPARFVLKDLKWNLSNETASSSLFIVFFHQIAVPFHTYARCVL